jgi:hypothetical protein
VGTPDAGAAGRGGTHVTVVVAYLLRMGTHSVLAHVVGTLVAVVLALGADPRPGRVRAGAVVTYVARTRVPIILAGGTGDVFMAATTVAADIQRARIPVVLAGGPVQWRVRAHIVIAAIVRTLVAVIRARRSVVRRMRAEAA